MTLGDGCLNRLSNSLVIMLCNTFLSDWKVHIIIKDIDTHLLIIYSFISDKVIDKFILSLKYIIAKSKYLIIIIKKLLCV